MTSWETSALERSASTWLVILALGASCQEPSSGPVAGGETNWLGPCQTTSECGAGVSCVCGVCTHACEDAGDCGADGVCVPAASGSLAACGTIPYAAMCLRTCAEGACTGGAECIAGACIFAAQSGTGDYGGAVGGGANADAGEVSDTGRAPTGADGGSDGDSGAADVPDAAGLLDAEARSGGADSAEAFDSDAARDVLEPPAPDAVDGGGGGDAGGDGGGGDRGGGNAGDGDAGDAGDTADVDDVESTPDTWEAPACGAPEPAPSCAPPTTWSAGSCTADGTLGAGCVLVEPAPIKLPEWECEPGAALIHSYWEEGPEPEDYPETGCFTFPSAPQGVFRSTDGGVCWEAVNTGILSGTGDDILESNYYSSYGQLNESMARVAVDPNDGSFVYATYRRLYRSADGGDSWSLVTTPELPDGIVAYPIATHPVTGRLYAAQGKGGNALLVSDDHGETFAHVSLDLQQWGGASGNFHVFVVAPHQVDPDVVYLAGKGSARILRSTDGGTSWEILKPGGVSDEIRAFATDPHDADRLWAGIGSTLFRSDDQGGTWVPLGSTPSASFLIVDPHMPGRLFALHQYVNGGILVSNDGGVTFSELTGLGTIGIRDLVPRPDKPGAMYVMGHTGANGLRYSADGGQIWISLTNGLPNFCGACLWDAFRGLAASPSSPDTLFLVVEATPCVPGG